MGIGSVWAVAENAAAIEEVMACAGAVGGPVTAVVIGEGLAADAARYGPADVLTAGGASPEPFTAAYAGPIAAAVRAAGLAAVVFAGSVSGRLLAGLVASALGTSALTGVTGVTDAAGRVETTRLVYGGAGVRTEQVLGPVAVICPAGGAFDAAGPGAPGAVPVSALAGAPDARGVVVTGTRPVEAEPVNLGAAARVVGVGRGFREAGDLALAEALAAALGAELACSRPVADESGWLPRERYVGVSGETIKPDLYVAVGISGQIQHMVGVAGAGTVVAVNKDPKAPIFKNCDIGLVADLYDVLPRLTVQLAA
jgi:electron transfer flavoprotein alpha subunit